MNLFVTRPIHEHKTKTRFWRVISGRVSPLLRRINSDTAGSVLIETAIAFMLGITMIFWITEFCVLTFTYCVLGDAARHGVRYAIAHGADSTNCSGPSNGCSDPTAANVISDVQSVAANFLQNLPAMTVQVTYPDTGGSTTPSRVNIAISYAYQPLMHFSGLTQTLHVSAQGRILY